MPAANALREMLDEFGNVDDGEDQARVDIA
jgi:hypothetical protein